MRIAGLVLLLLCATDPDLRAQRPVDDQSILQYLTRTIAWYRDATALAQGAVDTRQVVFADGLRQSSAEAVRLVFDFARAQAAIPAASAPANAGTGDARGKTLAQSMAVAEQRAEQAQLQVDQINRQLPTASGRARARLLALREEVTSEANFAKARRDALRSLIGFLSAPDEGGLGAKVAELERTVPEAATPRQKGAAEPAATARPAASEEFHPESSGIVGLTTEAFTVSQRISRLDRLNDETEALRNSAEQIRGPLRNALRDVIRRGDAVTQMPESSDVAALAAQKKEVDALLARFKQLSASTVALGEQAGQVVASRGRIVEWRRFLRERYNMALRYLLLRAAMLAIALLVLFGLSELWRRATVRYVQDLRRRRQFLLLRRIVIGCAVTLFVVLSFVTEFGSFATIAGFSAAGLAVAMQSVLVSMVAYFFLVGRWGVRVGDRVTVSGVTGEVADVGLFRLYLMELGGSGIAPQPTGRVVVFPNSVFFQPSAVFKQLPGVDYVWRAITLKLPATADYAGLQKRLLGIVEGIYAEYRDVVERQYNRAQSLLNLHTAPPHPESRVRFVDSGFEITVRYPVELSRAMEIEDRITREVAGQIETNAQLANTGAVKIETTQG